MTQTATGKFTPQTDHAARATDLAAENQALRARMAYLLEQAERNHSIMTRHQAFDLEIVGAGNFPELIGTIFRVLPVISELDSVTLTCSTRTPTSAHRDGQAGRGVRRFPRPDFR
jgi:two-component system cell cycle response regulator